LLSYSILNVVSSKLSLLDNISVKFADDAISFLNAIYEGDFKGSLEIESSSNAAVLKVR